MRLSRFKWFGRKKNKRILKIKNANGALKSLLMSIIIFEVSLSLEDSNLLF